MGVFAKSFTFAKVLIKINVPTHSDKNRFIHEFNRKKLFKVAVLK